MTSETRGTRSVSTTALTNLTLAGLGTVTGVIAARLLGPAGRGELAAVQLWPIFLGGLAALGLPAAVVYFAAGRPEQSGQLLSNAMVVGLATSIVIGTVGAVTAPHLLGKYSAEARSASRLLFLTLPLYTLGGTPLEALRGIGRVGAWNMLRLTAPLLWLAVLASSWATGNHHLRFIALGIAISSAVPLAVGTVVATRYATRPFRPTASLMQPMFRFGFPGLLTTIPQALNLRLDQMLLVTVVSSDRLGLYVAAVAWSSLPAAALSSLGMVVFPKLASEPNVAKRRDLLLRTLRLALGGSVALTVTSAVLTPIALPLLFGERFRAAIAPALVLVFAGGVLAWSMVIEDGFRGLGMPKVPLFAQLGGLVVTVLLLVLLIGGFDITGAAVASLGGYGTSALVSATRLRARFSVGWRELLVPRRSDLPKRTPTSHLEVGRNPPWPPPSVEHAAPRREEAL